MPYVDAARSRGVSEFRLVRHHAYKPALIPIITVIGLQIALLLGGAVLTETTFEWKGLGLPAGAVPAGPRLRRRAGHRRPARGDRGPHQLHRRHHGGDHRSAGEVLMKLRKLLGRLPVVHQFRQSVGLQRGMLVTGLVLTGFFVLMAIFAPVLAPYGFNQLTDDERRLVRIAGAARRRAPARHHGRRLRRAVSRDLGRADRVLRDHRRRAALDLRRRAARPALRIPRRLARPRAHRDRRRRLRVPDAAARDRRGHRDQQGPIEPRRRRLRGRHLDHRGLHPAVLPGDPRRGGPGEGRGVRRVGEGRRREHAARHVPPRAAQLDAHAAADLHAEQLGGDPRRSPRWASSASASSRPRRPSGATTSTARSAT